MQNATTKTPKALGLAYSSRRGYWVGSTPETVVPATATQRHSELYDGVVQEWLQDGWHACRLPATNATWAFRA